MKRFIVSIDNALSAAVCRRLVKAIRASPALYAGVTGQGLAKERKHSLDVELQDLPDADKYWDLLQKSVAAGLRQYALKNPSIAGVQPLKCFGFRAHLYPPGGFFDWHIDAYNVSVSRRVLSCIWYLNDVEEGGETEFKYQRVKIAPKCGRLLFFPAGFEYLHRSAPVTSADKIVMVTFLECDD